MVFSPSVFPNKIENEGQQIPSKQNDKSDEETLCTVSF